MVNTAQVAPNPDVTNQFICIGEQQVQYCIPLVGPSYLTQIVILNAFQELPELPAARCATFPADN